MHIDDVLMAQLAGLAYLLAQRRESLGAQFLLQDLDGKSLAGHLLIGDQVHDPHSAFTELALDTVAAPEQLTRCQAHRARWDMCWRASPFALAPLLELCLRYPLRGWTVLRAGGELRI